ncbi:MAG TPA: ABC transporter substrate-binding protein, partial [Paraburkholderia sp.]|nr:ABC transporter substrate-binding protein [Paraburkholderia sp.]
DVTIRRSHFTHSQPWSFRQGGNIPALWARSQGSDTRLIGLSWVDEFQALITLDRQLEATPRRSKDAALVFRSIRVRA